MRDLSGGLGIHELLMAETLGLEMARRAARILAKHREALTRIGPGLDGPGPDALDPDRPRPVGATTDDDTVGDGTEILDSPEFQADNVIFTAILDAANECLGRFDHRPAEQRWCDALVQILELAQAASSGGVSAS